MNRLLAMSDIHPRDRLAYWYDVACKVFVKHECHVDKSSSFDASIHQSTMGELSVIELDSTGLRSTAVTNRTIANQEDDVFLLGLQLEGSATLMQDGREANVAPGDFVLLDTRRPYSARYSAHWRRLFVKIPHRGLNARLAGSSQYTARAVGHASGIGGLTSDFLRLIPSRIDDLSAAARAQIGEQVLDLVALALASDAGKDKPAVSSGRSLALLMLRAAIESRLSDPRLDPTSAAAAAGISVRYANMLLAEKGTSLQRLIMSRRLEHCRRALEDPAQVHRTITEIAFAWGFSDLSHFDRRFKREYGCSPREYRQQSQP